MCSDAAPRPLSGLGYRDAKLDSLSALAAAVEAFPPAMLAEHMSGVWVALRSELLAPAAEALPPAEVPAAEEVAAATAACLARCLAALQAKVAAEVEGAAACCQALAGGALDNSCVQDLESCVRSSGGTDTAAFRRSVLRVSALTRVLAALAEAGGEAAARAAALLPRVVQASGAAAGPEAAAAGCLAWASVTAVLRAARRSALDASLLHQLAEAAAAGASSRDSAGSSGGGGGGPEGGQEQALAAGQQVSLWSTSAEECTPRRRVWLQLAVLEALLREPQLAAALQEQQVQAAVAAALSCIETSSSSRDPLCQQGTAVLSALAGSSHAVALSQHVLPALLEAATQAGGSESALAALRGLAAASLELQAEVLIALDTAIQACLASSSGCGLARLLLQAAAGILLAAEAEGQRAAGLQCAQLSGHLLNGALGMNAAAAASVAADAQLVRVMAEAAYYGARAADEEQQGRLAAAAAEALSNGPDGTLRLAVCSAVLAPASPGALAAALPADVGLATALRLARVARGSAAGGTAGSLAALAAAALLNKNADAAQLDISLGTFLDGDLLCAATGMQGGGVADLSVEGDAGWLTLAVVTQGLAMRGHRAADAVVSRVLSHLRQLEMSQASGQQQPLTMASAKAANCAGPPPEQRASAAKVRAAAGFFRAVLAVDEGPAALALNKRSHAVTRPLWQQRLYTKASSEVLAALQACAHEPAAAPHSAPLLLALAQLLRSAPAAVSAADLPRLLPWLLQSLDTLQHEPWADASLLEALLRQLSDFLASDAGRSAADEALAALVPALLGLAAFRGGQKVRSAALECLLRLTTLPYTSLHPYRRRVAKAGAAACDDPRRLVRLQAARVRQAWAG